MRLRNIPSARDELAASPYVIAEEDMPRMKGRWSEAFDRLRGEVPGEGPGAPRRPLHLEIGMGKGRFLLELARRNPQIDYIGIENYSSVLVHPVRKLDAMKNEGQPLTNILLLRMNAEYLTDLFAPAEADRIYLNFSDPWPKDRHAKRRLPGRVFLGRYAQVLAPGAHVEFKTDNRSLFDFALEETKEAGWTLDACTFDLHHDPIMNQGNIMTEYEERFSAKGNPICKLIEHPGV